MSDPLFFFIFVYLFITTPCLLPRFFGLVVEAPCALRFSLAAAMRPEGQFRVEGPFRARCRFFGSAKLQTKIQNTIIR
jgi:hypothetical protein